MLFFDLYIVGCGVLGKRVAKAWREQFPDAKIVGETATARSHDELRSLNIEPVLRSERKDLCDFVLFCTPPKAYTDDYPREIEAARPTVMISSGGVYAEDGGGVCSEGSPTLDTPRAVKLLKAEEAALKHGCVVRCAGLYTLERGAHEYWYNMGEVTAREDSLVNLLHYDDAASCAVAALLKGEKGDVFLAADMNPRTRQDIVDAAQVHPRFKGRHVAFVGGEPSRGPAKLGKKYDCSFTKRKLGWEPKYASIDDFFNAVA